MQKYMFIGYYILFPLHFCMQLAFSFSPAPRSGTLLCPVTSHICSVCCSCASTGAPEMGPALARSQRQATVINCFPTACLSSYWAFQMPPMPKDRRKPFSETVHIQDVVSVAEELRMAGLESCSGSTTPRKSVATAVHSYIQAQAMEKINIVV